MVILAGAVYASLQAAPNPGHPVSELQKCSEGEILKIIGGVWTCSADNVGSVKSAGINYSDCVDAPNVYNRGKTCYGHSIRDCCCPANYTAVGVNGGDDMGGIVCCKLI